MKLRLFHKFLIIMVLVSALPMALLGLRLISLGQLGVRTAILELHLTRADRIAADINSYLRSSDEALRSAGAAMAAMDWENKQVLLSTLLEARREIREISVLSRDGKELVKMLTPYGHGAGKLKNYPSVPEFKAALGGKRSISLLDKGRTAVFYYPFGKNMALRAELDMAAFFASMDLKRLGAKGFPLILDSSAEPIAWPKGLPQETVDSASGWQISRNAVKALSAASTEFKDGTGQAMLGAYAPIPEIGGAVVVVQPQEGAYRYAMFLRTQAVYAVLLFLTLSFMAAWVMSRSLAKPINELNLAAERVAAGDFTRGAEVDASGELKELGQTFNKMVGQLKSYSDMQLDRIIHEQKNTEAILFSTEDGIIMTDLEGRVELVNRKARSVLGIGMDAPVDGQTLAGLIADPAIREAVLDVFSSGSKEHYREVEVELEHSRRVFKSLCVPITAPGHAEPIGRLVAFNDITLDKELIRIKDEFLHSITHDLRNPMGAIKGFVEFLVKEIPGPVNEAQKKMLISIDRASFRLLGMINNILDVAKMEAGKMEVKLAPINLREIAARVIELMESLGQRKRLRFEMEGDAEAVVNADAGLMERLFTNLIGNAIKFTPENGVITVGISCGDKQVTGWVRDTGDGIPPEYIDKIFAKFEQVRGQKAGGTGLGLTICKHVAAVHLGKIWAESAPGRGSKFTFSIPRSLGKNAAGAVIDTGEIK